LWLSVASDKRSLQELSEQWRQTNAQVWNSDTHGN
jgi:hypothetical protein